MSARVDISTHSRDLLFNGLTKLIKNESSSFSKKHSAQHTQSLFDNRVVGGLSQTKFSLPKSLTSNMFFFCCIFTGKIEVKEQIHKAPFLRSWRNQYPGHQTQHLANGTQLSQFSSFFFKNN